MTIKRDATAPVITFSNRTPTANANGWNNTNVTVNWSCSDTMSGVVSASVGQVVSTEGASQSATETCMDNAGNTASNTQTGINIDQTAPTISDLGPTTSPNANGWYKTDVVNQFKASDSLSGLDTTCEAAFPDPVSGGRRQDKTTSGEGAAVKVSSSSCTDLAGNTASAMTAPPS